MAMAMIRLNKVHLRKSYEIAQRRVEAAVRAR